MSRKKRWAIGYVGATYLSVRRESAFRGQKKQREKERKQMETANAGAANV